MSRRAVQKTDTVQEVQRSDCRGLGPLQTVWDIWINDVSCVMPTAKHPESAHVRGRGLTHSSAATVGTLP